MMMDCLKIIAKTARMEAKFYLGTLSLFIRQHNWEKSSREYNKGVVMETQLLKQANRNYITAKLIFGCNGHVSVYPLLRK